MERSLEQFEKIRTRLHELTAANQQIVIRMSLTELNLKNAVKDINDHDIVIRKLEKFMYMMIGIGIAVQIIIELVFKAFAAK
jgi:hypothetical protein